MRQVPAPSVAAWLLDLTAARGPRVVVLRRDEAQAHAAFVEQLIAIGVLASADEARELVAEAISEPVEVIW